MVEKTNAYVVYDGNFILNVFLNKDKAIECAIKAVDERTNEKYNHKYIRKILEKSMNYERSEGFVYSCSANYVTESIGIMVFEIDD